MRYWSARSLGARPGALLGAPGMGIDLEVEVLL
jgi:hypothetical protein